MPYDHSLAERIGEAFAEKGIEFEAKPIMGILCFMVNGRMCAGLLGQRLIIRIDPADEAVVHAKPGCKPMYFTGRPMKEFKFIDSNGTGSREQLLEWLEFALRSNREEQASKGQRVQGGESVHNEELPDRLSNADPAR